MQFAATIFAVEGMGVWEVGRGLDQRGGRFSWQTLYRLAVREVDEVLTDEPGLLAFSDTEGNLWRLWAITLELYDQKCRTKHARTYPSQAALERALNQAFDLVG